MGIVLIKKIKQVAMKRIIGCIAFWVAVGMLLMLLLGNEILGIICIAILMVIGYNLNCS